MSDYVAIDWQDVAVEESRQKKALAARLEATEELNAKYKRVVDNLASQAATAEARLEAAEAALYDIGELRHQYQASAFARAALAALDKETPKQCPECGVVMDELHDLTRHPHFGPASEGATP